MLKVWVILSMVRMEIRIAVSVGAVVDCEKARIDE